MKSKSAVLTKEERDILVLVGQSLTNDEIAECLAISVSKVKALIHSACLKLKAHNRNEAIVYAMKRGDPSIDEFYSIDEITDFFSGLGANKLRSIARLLKQKRQHGAFQLEDTVKFNRGKKESFILTRREQDVIVLVGRGLTNKEMADILSVSVSAVRAFMHRAFKKLGVRNRTEAYIVALKQKAINLEEVASLGDLVEMLAKMGPEPVETMTQLLNPKPERKRVSAGSQFGLNLSNVVPVNENVVHQLS